MNSTPFHRVVLKIWNISEYTDRGDWGWGVGVGVRLAIQPGSNRKACGSEAGGMRPLHSPGLRELAPGLRRSRLSPVTPRAQSLEPQPSSQNTGARVPGGPVVSWTLVYGGQGEVLYMVLH